MKQQSPISRASSMKRPPIRRSIGLVRKVVAAFRPGRIKVRSVEQVERQQQWNRITGTKVAFGQGCARCDCRGYLGNRLIGHHVLKASRGGPWTSGNHLLLCELCHRWVHDNEIAATAAGWLMSGHVHIRQADSHHTFTTGANHV